MYEDKRRENDMKKGILKGLLLIVCLLITVVLLNASGRLDTGREKNEVDRGKIIEKCTINNFYLIVEGEIIEPPSELILG